MRSEVDDSFVEHADERSNEQMNQRTNARRLHEAGMMILAGSDVQFGVFPGAALHRDIAALADIREVFLQGVPILRSPVEVAME